MSHPTGPRTRSIHRLLLVCTMLAMIFGGFVALAEPASAAGYHTTSTLNLRTGPGTSFDVIEVIPSGAAVEVTGDAQFGYLPVDYNGSSGFASADYLTSGSADESSDIDDGAVETGSGPAGTWYVFDGRLNLRSGPGTSYGVILVLPDDAAVSLTGETANGYSKLDFDGNTGWAATQYLTDSGGSSDDADVDDSGSTGDDTSGDSVPVGDTVIGNATTTSGLNLRTGPGTSFTAQLVIPNGASVEIMGEGQNGFLPVRYNGTTGWSSADYLTTGGDTGEDTGDDDASSPDDSGTAVGDTVTGSATTTARLNLRTGPGTSFDVLQIMPEGAAVELMGDAQSGFSPVRYDGTTGWASTDYLGSGDDGGADDGSDDTGTDPGDSGTTVDKVTRVAVNMRSEPTTSSSIVWVLPPGTRISVTGSAQNGFLPANWAHVSGWVHTDYLANVGEIPDPGAANAHEQEMIDIIYAAADRWGQPRSDMLRVARCESALDPNNVNPASGTSGLFQFRPSTFAFTPNGERGEDIFDPYSNADAAGWMWANGMRNHWACQ